VLLDKSVTGLPKHSVAMIQQIRTISHNRLSSLSGSITNSKIQDAILDACRSYFDL